MRSCAHAPGYARQYKRPNGDYRDRSTPDSYGVTVTETRALSQKHSPHRDWPRTAQMPRERNPRKTTCLDAGHERPQRERKRDRGT